ncbi:MAG: class I SAM-dependent rRNA methyltransferase, partial [Deltaproteobacteria bacterium]|nr:class I SAM-dependent rRNA methyltransferase [Deltaproteobacteria bacterium]
VARAEGDLSPGEIGEVYSGDGKFLGMGQFNPRSQIILRLLTRRREVLDSSFFRGRLLQADALREKELRAKTNGYRAINAEGDFLPGLIVDRYGEILVLQCLTAGMERLKGLFIDLLVRHFNPKSIYERSDVPARKEEDLPMAKGLLYGEEILDPVEIEEYGCRFRVDVKEGQKTGFYLDQRENRFSLQKVSHGKKILDCFCYSGGFSIHAGLGGAKEITMIDSSEEALKRAKDHFALNHLKGISPHLIRGDAFEVMRSLEPDYDIIVLDPPPFAKKKAHLPGASRGYKDLNLQAFRLLKREGLLFTFSCSHHMNWDLFQKIVFSAAVDANRRVQLLDRRAHPIDHPVDLSHPEGEYLRGMVCRVL